MASALLKRPRRTVALPTVLLPRRRPSKYKYLFIIKPRRLRVPNGFVFFRNEAVRFARPWLGTNFAKIDNEKWINTFFKRESCSSLLKSASRFYLNFWNRNINKHVVISPRFTSCAGRHISNKLSGRGPKLLQHTEISSRLSTRDVVVPLSFPFRRRQFKLDK